MDFRILGPIEVVAEGQPVRLGGPKQRALLAYLVLREGEVVQASRLLEEVWHDPPAGGTAALHSHVSRLRRAIGVRIATIDSGYALRLADGDTTDLHTLRLLLAKAGSAAPAAERARLLREADGLWRGTPFDGLDVPFVAGEAVALEELRLAAIEERLEAELEAGRDGELVAELRALVAHHPLRERPRRQLILALYRSGRQAEALEAYRETRRMFDQELGLELSPALTELERAILQHDSSLDVEKPTRVALLPPRRRRLALLVAAGVVLGVAGAATAFLVSRPERVQPAAAAPGSTRAALRRIHDSTVVRKPVYRRLRVRTVRSVTTVAARTTTAPRTTIAAPTTVVLARVTTAPRPTSTIRARKRVVVSRPVPHTTTVARTATQPVSLRTWAVSDDFNGTSVDPLVWSQVSKGAGWSMSEKGGHFELAFEPGATADALEGVYGGQLRTQCRFPQDFDAQVDFTLVQWPENARIGAFMWAYLGPQPLAWSIDRGSFGSESYDATLDSVASVTDADVTGRLRLVRRDGVVTAAFLHNGLWVTVATAPSRGAARIGVGALGGEGKDVPFNGQPVVIDFDNFKVTATHPLCPPGSPLTP